MQKPAFERFSVEVWLADALLSCIVFEKHSSMNLLDLSVHCCWFVLHVFSCDLPVKVFRLLLIAHLMMIAQNCKTEGSAKGFLAARGILHYYDLAEAHQHE